MAGTGDSAFPMQPRQSKFKFWTDLKTLNINRTKQVIFYHCAVVNTASFKWWGTGGGSGKHGRQHLSNSAPSKASLVVQEGKIQILDFQTNTNQTIQGIY